MEKRWNLLQADPNKVDSLHATLKINKKICQILTQRGYDNFDKAKTFFRPSLDHLHSPWLMKDMRKATDRVQTAINNQEKILIYGDYDVDGTTSVACLYQFLSKIYTKVAYYIPNRYTEGYGVSEAGIQFAKSNNFSLIISLDCGIKSVDLIAVAKEMKIDFIVCDHHLPDLVLPPAVAILNPKQPDCNYPYKELCGCGVGFKLMTALAETFNLPAESYLQYLDLVATAIAADIVSMTGENRVLAYFGLQKVNTQPCEGIRALMQLAKVEHEMLISSLVFIIAPRVNAAGRMDDAKKAVQLFIEQDPNKALELAGLLHTDNTNRKEKDTNITLEALAIIEEDVALRHKKSTVVYREHWHKGVVGIVASRLIETYYRPTVVLTKSQNGFAAGSARSVVGFNLYEAIHACREHLAGYGGHFAAAGMTLSVENINAFAQKFEEVVTQTIHPNSLLPELVIDAEVQLSELSLSFYNIVKQMQPFGPDNQQPVFVLKNVYDTGQSKVVKEQHLKFCLRQNNTTIQGIGFNMANKINVVKSNQPLDVVFTLDENDWNGNKSLQLKVCDCRIHLPEATG